MSSIATRHGTDADEWGKETYTSFAEVLFFCARQKNKRLGLMIVDAQESRGDRGRRLTYLLRVTLSLFPMHGKAQGREGSKQSTNTNLLHGQMIFYELSILLFNPMVFSIY